MTTAGSSMAFLSGDLRAEGGNSRADVALPASKAGGERHLETIGAIAFEPALPVAPSPTGTNEDGQSADEEPSPKRQRTMGGQELLYEADLAVEDDPDATRALEERLAEYNRLKAKHKDNAKPDMVASSEMRSAGRVPDFKHGLLPGVKTGRFFNEKGELEVAGLHKGIVNGIGYPEKSSRGLKAAYSIVLSGAYKDDKDSGEDFEYTGQGYKGDQKYTAGNLALKISFETATPVRVMRKMKKEGAKKGSYGYIYEGLYDVTNTWVEASTEPGVTRQVIKFRLQRHHTNSKAAAPSVEFSNKYYMALNSLRRYERVNLVGTRRQHSKPVRLESQETLEVREERRLGELRARQGLMADDISGGQEQLRIPVFNTEDEEPIPDIQYIRLTHVSKKAKPIVETAASSADRLILPPIPGLYQPVRQAQEVYKARARLLYENCPEGIDESEAPPRYRIVQQGIQFPLEVFRTPGGRRGWGVRSSEMIPGGSFVCEYAGRLIPDHKADAKGMGDDDYFFGMDHFYHMLRYFHDHPEKIVEGPIPSDMEAAMNKKLEVLENAPVLDAKRMGNVGRFINHSNDGNLVIQPVITEPNHSLIFYRIAFFAVKDIEPFEELTYDYGYQHGPEHVIPAWARGATSDDSPTEDLNLLLSHESENGHASPPADQPTWLAHQSSSFVPKK